MINFKICDFIFESNLKYMRLIDNVCVCYRKIYLEKKILNKFFWIVVRILISVVYV